MQGQYYRLLYHAVWATKCRDSLLDPELRAAVHRYLKGKVREYGGTPLAVGGIGDHVHLVFSVPPQAPIAAVIGRLKGTSSHWVNHVFRPGAGFAWQGGYGAFSISEGDLAGACGYVDDREEHHRRGTLRLAYEAMGIQKGKSNGDYPMLAKAPEKPTVP